MEDTEILSPHHLLCTTDLEDYLSSYFGTLETNLANKTFCAEDMKSIPICLRAFIMDDLQSKSYRLNVPSWC